MGFAAWFLLNGEHVFYRNNPSSTIWRTMMNNFSVRFSEEGYSVHFQDVTVMDGLTRIEAREAAKLLEERWLLSEGNNLTHG